MSPAIQKYTDEISMDHRYCSFDFCYNYFREKTRTQILNDMEKSCLVLGFYLASWGMLRGSSYLLEKNAKFFQPLIEYIAKVDKRIWNIDVDRYTDENIALILSVYKEIKAALGIGKKSDLVLVTKTMLGVFGIIPAFDKNFTSAFRQISNNKCGFRKLNEKSLNCIKTFYEANKLEIIALSKNLYTKDFKSGDNTVFLYPKAKIIDMYGFIMGQKN
jgi:hypothetical protein